MRSDADLVAAAAGGDRTAWDGLVERHSQLVYANARAVGADSMLAHDVGQVVWMRLLNRLDTIREPSKIRGWLAIVARNTAREQLRRQRHTSGLDAFVNLPDPSAPSPEGAAVLSDEVAELERGLQGLSDKCRELLTLLYSAQMTYDEVVVAMEIPIGSIGPTRQRCLGSLRRLMTTAGAN